MKYILQVRFGAADETLAASTAEQREQVTAQFEAIRRRPEVLDARRLGATETAVTVRVENGETVKTDGPPVALTDAIDGLYIIEGDLEDAAAFAARVPVAALGGTVEIRQLRGD